jgi:hypothetical protein
MNDPDLRTRLEGLIAALAPSTAARPAIGDAAAPDATRAASRAAAPDAASDADTQRIATTQIDDLLRRVVALSGVLGAADGRGWDDVDQVAAQLLIADLSAISSTTRALNSLAASRLAGALADLREAAVDVQRAVKETSDS